MKKIFFTSALLILSVVQLSAQAGRNINTNGIPLIGVEAPSFTAQSTIGPVNFPSDFGNGWKILFAHPKNFTPVCSSEILELAYHQDSFDRLGTKLVVISTDKLDQHRAWKAALEEISYKDREPVKIQFPLVEDDTYKVSGLYGMIHSAVSVSENIRGIFIIDPQNKVRAIFYYPNEVGRNIEEIKRTLTALQATYNNRNLVTPVNWVPGDDFMVPVMTQDDRLNVGNPDSEFYQYSWFMTFMKKK
jgi:peroxiredoxin 2/4